MNTSMLSPEGRFTPTVMLSPEGRFTPTVMLSPEGRFTPADLSGIQPGGGKPTFLTEHYNTFSEIHIGLSVRWLHLSDRVCGRHRFGLYYGNARVDPIVDVRNHDLLIDII